MKDARDAAKGFGFTVSGAGVVLANPLVENKGGWVAAGAATVEVSSFETVAGLEIEKGGGESANEARELKAGALETGAANGLETGAVVAEVVAGAAAPTASDAKGFGFMVSAAGVVLAKPPVENSEGCCVATGAAAVGVSSLETVAGLEMEKEKGDGEGANGVGALKAGVLETGATKGLGTGAVAAGVVVGAVAPEGRDEKGFRGFMAWKGLGGCPLEGMMG